MTNSVSRYQLPVGFPHEDQIFRKVSLSPIRGKVRKELGKEHVRENPSLATDLVFQNCLDAIGNIKIEDDSDIPEMLTGADRDFIILKLREISMGKVVNFDFNCNNCNSPITGKVNVVEDIDTEILSDEELHKMRDGELYTFEIDTSNSEKEIVQNSNNKGRFYLPRGIESNQISDTVRENPIEAQYDLYYLCMLTWNGKTKEELDENPFDVEIAGVIDYISSKFGQNVPGPDFSVTFICSECGQEMPADLESSDFLFPTTQNEKS